MKQVSARPLEMSAERSEARQTTAPAKRSHPDRSCPLDGLRRSFASSHAIVTPSIDQAIALHRRGELERAAALYRAILDAQPDHADALHLLGLIAYQSGDDERAVDLVQRAIALDDSQAEPHNHLGLALMRQGRLDEAAVQFETALQRSPESAQAHNNLGTVRRRQGRLDEAMASYGSALGLDPAYANAHFNLGQTERARGDLRGAAQSFIRGVSLDPESVDGIAALADVLHTLGDLTQAKIAYQQTLALDASHAPAWWGIACIEETRDEFAAAAACLMRAVALAPQWGEAHHNLGRALFQLGQVDAAIDALRRAAALLPPGERSLGTIATIIPGSPRADNQAVTDARAAWAAVAAPSGPSPQATRAATTPGPRRLRIGYLSAFFHHRNWMKPVWGLINHHDRDRFEVCLFSDAPRAAIEHGYREHEQDRFHDLSGLTNADAARVIDEAQLDLLIDLNAYSRLARLPMLALKPAPILVAWFNLFASSGVSAFDYVIGDRHVLPAGERAFYRERSVRLRRSYLTFEVTYPVPDVAPAPCLSRGHITFGCLSPQYKITPQVVDAWSTILRACPDSRLLLANSVLGSAANRHFVLDLFATFDVPADRLDLHGPAEHFDFLDKYAGVDVALDPFPYNGGTTTMEALWQGTPVLTFSGDRWASRISASLLHAAGLSQFVAPDLEGHIRFAIDLARDPETPARLDALRRTMRDHLRRSSVCDVRAFTRDMERIYRHIWRQHGAGRR
jgi:protein O-GlcNAc transferase